MTGPVAATSSLDGLQVERTALAWHRTGLALLVNASLLVRLIGLSHRYWLVVPATVGVAAGLAAWRPTPPGRQRRTTCVAYATVAAAIAVVSVGVVAW